jgi:hypothetical protein
MLVVRPTSRIRAAFRQRPSIQKGWIDMTVELAASIVACYRRCRPEVSREDGLRTPPRYRACIPHAAAGGV